MTIKIDIYELGEIINKFYREKGFDPTGLTVKLKEDADGSILFSHIEVKTKE